MGPSQAFLWGEEERGLHHALLGPLCLQTLSFWTGDQALLMASSRKVILRDVTSHQT